MGCIEKHPHDRLGFCLIGKRTTQHPSGCTALRQQGSGHAQSPHVNRAQRRHDDNHGAAADNALGRGSG